MTRRGPAASQHPRLDAAAHLGLHRPASLAQRSSSAWRSSPPSCRSSCSCRRSTASTPSGVDRLFAIAGIFVLLALGLNIVVGMAGLLDLGYAAFFAIGAYTYAFAALRASPVSTPVLGHAPRRRGRRRGVRHPARRPDAAPARRLPGDRDLGLRRDRADRVPQRRASTPTAPNGIAGIDRARAYRRTTSSRIIGNPLATT